MSDCQPAAVCPPDPQLAERNTAALIHLSALSVLVGIPLGNLIGPLVVWLLKKDQSEFVDRHGRAAVDFQITLTVALGALFMVAVLFASRGEPITLGLVIPIGLSFLFLAGIFTVVAIARAKSGETYRYPLSLPWI